MRTYTDVHVEDDGTWSGHRAFDDDERGTAFLATPSLVVIEWAYYGGCDLEDLADGYGPGQGTHGDWSGIRDSSDEAIDAMLARSLTWVELVMADRRGVAA